MLLHATERVLIREGVEGVTRKRVAAEAGVSAATLYQYYPARDALVAAWEEHFWESLLQRFATHADLIVNAREPLRDQVYTAVYAAADLIARMVRLYRFD